MIDGKSYAKSKLAHFYKTGEWPKKYDGPLTQERLREHLYYDPDTGIFTRRKSVGRFPVGTKAGTVRKGYIDISIDYCKYTAGRLAWLYMTGEWPKEFVDHRNGNKSDNRWSNLREATKAENGWNRGANARNPHGLKGAHKKRNKFESSIMKNGKRVRLGYFDTPEDAHEAYCKAAKNFYGDYHYEV